MTAPQSLDALVHPNERGLFALLLVISVVTYAGLLTGLTTAPAAVIGLLTYVVLFAAVFGMMHGLMVGHLRGNGVRVTAKQFPTLYRLVHQHAATLGMTRVPSVYVLQAGGVLNAFATRFLGRDFVVIYSDVLEMAEARGEAAVGFIVGHELAHVRRGHLRWRWLTLPGRMVPYLGAAWSRACEYTCDRMGAHCQPDGAIDGLLVLGAGKRLYVDVDVREYAEQARTEYGFWVRWAELLASHPHLPKRVGALLAAGVTPTVRAGSFAPGAPIDRLTV